MAVAQELQQIGIQADQEQEQDGRHLGQGVQLGEDRHAAAVEPREQGLAHQRQVDAAQREGSDRHARQQLPQHRGLAETLRQLGPQLRGDEDGA